MISLIMNVKRFPEKTQMMHRLLSCVLIVTVGLLEPLHLAGRVWAESETGRPLMFEIPQGLGDIVELYQGRDPRAIVILQDLHCAPAAQRALANITQHLARREKFRLVAMEGASGRIDPAVLGALPERVKRETVLDTLMEDGSLTGLEWLAARGSEKIHLWGAENPALYRKNLEVYAAVKRGAEPSWEIMERIDRGLDRAKRRRHSPGLYRLDQSYWAYRDGAGSLDRLLEQMEIELDGRGEDLPHPLNSYLKLSREAGRLDHERLNRELAGLMKTLETVLDRRNTARLVKMSLQLRLGTLSEYDFFTGLEDLAHAANIRLKSYPESSGYLNLLKRRSSINPGALDTAVHETARRVLTRVSDDLFDDSINFHRLEKLLKLQLGAQDWKAAGTPDFWLEVTARAGTYLPYEMAIEGRAQLEAWSEQARLFYTAADERNAALVEATLARMRTSGLTRSILVCGGFHSSGIAQILRSLDISYCVVLARVSDLESPRYEDRLLARPVALDALFSPAASSTAAFHDGTVQALAPPVQTAVEPLVYPDLRETILKKAYVLYELLSFWESGAEPSRDKIREVREAFLGATQGPERRALENFLDAMRMDRIGPDGDGGLWIRAKLGDQAYRFHLIRKGTAFELTPLAEGDLDHARGVSFRIFPDTADAMPKAPPETIWQKFRRVMADRSGAAGVAGLFSSVFFITLFSYASWVNPAFRFGRDYLSELGESVVSWPFNLAMLVSGAFMGTVGWTAMRRHLAAGWERTVGLTLLSVSGILLMLVGIFTLSSPLHVVVAGAFFASASAALLFLSRLFAQSRTFGWPLAAVALITVGLCIGYLVTLSPALETAAVIAHFTGISLTGYQLVRAALKDTAPKLEGIQTTGTSPAISGAVTETVTEPVQARKPLTDNTEVFVDKVVQSFSKTMQATPAEARARWPDGMAAVEEILRQSAGGTPEKEAGLDTFREKAREELAEMGKIILMLPGEDPYRAVLSYLIVLGSGALKEGGDSLVRDPELGLRILDFVQPGQWLRTLLVMDFQYDYPLFDVLARDAREILTASIHDVLQAGNTDLKNRLNAFVMKSAMSRDDWRRLAAGLEPADLEMWIRDGLTGSSGLAGLEKFRHRVKDLAIVLAEKTGRHPLDIVVSQSAQIQTLSRNHLAWLRFVRELITEVPLDAGRKEALAREISRLKTSAETGLPRPYLDLAGEILQELSAARITGAVTLASEEGERPRTIARGRISGNRVVIQGLADDENKLIENTIKNFMATYLGYDFSDARIRIVEGGNRLAELDGRTIVIDRRALRSRPLLWLETGHEMLEFLMDQSKLAFKEPAVREAVILLSQLQLFQSLSTSEKSALLQALITQEDMDTGNFSRILYGSMPESERVKISDVLAGRLDPATVRELELTPVLDTNEDKIGAILKYLAQDIYEPVIRTGAARKSGAMVREITEGYGESLTRLAGLRDRTLEVALEKWTRERFPDATRAQVAQWVQVSRGEIESERARNRIRLLRSGILPAAGWLASGVLLILAKSVVVGGAFFPGLLLAFGAAAVVVLTGYHTLRNILQERRWLRDRAADVTFDQQSGTIRVSPYASPKKLERRFKTALEQLAGHLERRFHERRPIAEAGFQEQLERIQRPSHLPVFAPVADLPFIIPPNAGEMILEDTRVVWRLDSDMLVGFDTARNQFFTVMTQRHGMTLRDARPEEIAEFQRAVHSFPEANENPVLLKLLSNAFRASPTVRTKPRDMFRVLAEGTVWDRAVTLKPLRKSSRAAHSAPGWSEQISDIVSEFMKTYPTVRWDRVSFRIVQGDERMAHFTDYDLRQVITLDEEAFKSPALLRLELTHELVHLVLKDIPRIIPPAIEEIIVIRYVADLFKNWPAADQAGLIRMLRDTPGIDKFGSWKLYVARLGPTGRKDLLEALENDPEWAQAVSGIPRYTIQGFDKMILDYLTLQDDEGLGTYPPVIQEYLTYVQEPNRPVRHARSREDVYRELKQYQIPIAEIFSITDRIRALIKELQDPKLVRDARWRLLRQTISLLDKLHQMYGAQARRLSVRIANAAMVNMRRLDDPKAAAYLYRRYLKIASRYQGDLDPGNPDTIEFLNNLLWLAGQTQKHNRAGAKDGYRAAGGIFLDRARFRDALEIFEKGLSEFPADVPMLLDAGLAAQNLGLDKKTLRYYRTALNRDPWDEKIHEALSHFFDSRREFTWSIAHGHRAQSLARRSLYGYGKPFRSMNEAVGALESALKKTPDKARDPIDTWAQCVVEDGLLHDALTVQPDSAVLSPHAALLAEALEDRILRQLENEAVWIQALLSPHTGTVDALHSVLYGVSDDDWKEIRSGVSTLFSEAGPERPGNLRELSEKTDAAGLWEKMIRLGGPKALNPEAIEIRTHLMRLLQENKARLSRLADSESMVETVRSSLPAWMAGLGRNQTSSFKTAGRPGADLRQILAGRFLSRLGWFVYAAEPTPGVLSAVLKSHFTSAGPALDLTNLSVMVVKDMDTLARVDTGRRIIYIDERIVHSEGLLRLELAEETAHLVIHKYFPSVRTAEFPALEEIAAMQMKIEFFSKMDPVAQSEILLELDRHPDWDRGDFAQLLAASLTPNRVQAVRGAAREVYGRDIPDRMFREPLDSAALTGRLIQYLFSVDTRGKPLFESAVTEPLARVAEDLHSKALDFVKKIAGRMRNSGDRLITVRPGRDLFRESFLASLESWMEFSDRELMLTGALVKAFAEHPEDPPTQADWLHAYVDFVLPSLDLSSDCRKAVAAFRTRLAAADADTFTMKEWMGWIRHGQELNHVADQEVYFLERMASLPAVLTGAVARLGLKEGEAGEVALAKLLLFAEHQSRRYVRMKAAAIPVQEKWLLEAAIAVLHHVRLDVLKGVCAHAGRDPGTLVSPLTHLGALNVPLAAPLAAKLLPVGDDQQRPLSHFTEEWIGIPAEEIRNWLSSVLKSSSFETQFGVQRNRMEHLRIQSLVPVMQDMINKEFSDTLRTPYFVEIFDGTQWKYFVMTLNREVDFDRLAAAGAFVPAMAHYTGQLWKRGVTFHYTKYTLDEALAEKSLTDQDKVRLKMFLADELAGRVGVLAGQLLDALYYPGRMESLGRDALEWTSQRTGESRTLYEAILSLRLDEFEQIKAHLVERLRKRESEKLAGYIRAGLSWNDLQKIFADQLAEVLLLFSLERPVLLNEAAKHPILAPLIADLADYWFGPASARPDLPAVDWESRMRRYESFLQWQWPLQNSDAKDFLERLISRIEPAMKVVSMPYRLVDERSTVASEDLTLAKHLVDKHGQVRNYFFLILLSKTPPEVVREIVPRLSEDLRRRLRHGAHLLNELGFEDESGELIKHLALQGPVLALWRSIAELFIRRVEETESYLDDVYWELLRTLEFRLGLNYKRTTAAHPMETEIHVIEILEGHLWSKGYRLSRHIRTERGRRFYEGVAPDGLPVLIQFASGQARRDLQTVSHSPRRVDEWFDDIHDISPELHPSQPYPAGYEVWSWPRHVKFDEWVLRKPLDLSDASRALKTLLQFPALMEKNPDAYQSPGVAPLWVSGRGDLVLSPVSERVIAGKRVQWAGDFLPAVRIWLEKTSEALPDLVKSELEGFKDAGMQAAVLKQLQVLLAAASEALSAENIEDTSSQAVSDALSSLHQYLIDLDTYIVLAQKSPLRPAVQPESLANEDRSRLNEEAA